MFDDQVEVGQAYLAEAKQRASIGSYIPPTTRSQLENKKDYLEQELVKVNDAIKALDDNPNLEQFMEVIKRAQR